MAVDSTLDKGSERNRRRIEGYLGDVEYPFEKAHHSKTAWALTVHHPSGFKVGIFQLQGKIGRIGINGGVIVSDDQRAALRALPVSERTELANAIRLKLLDYALDFYGVDDPLETINISNVVFLDGLTKAGFSDKLEQVIRGKLAIICLIDQQLGYLRPNSLKGEVIN